MWVFSFRIRNSCIRGCHCSCFTEIRFANPTKKNKGQTDTFTRTVEQSCAEIPKHSPTGGSSSCTTITIRICRSTPFIVLFFLLLVLLILPLPFPTDDDDDDCIHPLDCEPYNNNSNSDSVVEERPCRSNSSKPIDTPNKQERNAFTSSSNRSTPFRSPAYPATTQPL